MNVKDICQLQYKHIKGDTVEYVRAKTIETETEIKPIHFKLNKSISSIIKELGNQDNSPDAYMFNILYHGDSAQKIRKKVKNKIHLILSSGIKYFQNPIDKKNKNDFKNALKSFHTWVYNIFIKD